MFSGDYLENVRWPEWDITPDGSRFVLVKIRESTNTPVVVPKWFAELETLIGTR